MIDDKQQTASIPAQTVPVYGTINDNDLSTSSIFKSHAYECTEVGVDDHTPHHHVADQHFMCQTNRQRALYIHEFMYERGNNILSSCFLLP